MNACAENISISAYQYNGSELKGKQGNPSMINNKNKYNFDIDIIDFQTNPFNWILIHKVESHQQEAGASQDLG